MTPGVEHTGRALRCPKCRHALRQMHCNTCNITWNITQAPTTKTTLSELDLNIPTFLLKEFEDKPKIQSTTDCLAHLQDLKSSDRELLVVFLLNTKLQVTHRYIVSVGTLTSTEASVREVFRAAILHSAHSIIIAHNHPSGKPTPSEADNLTTKRLTKAAKHIGIQILEHLIFASHTDDYYSYRRYAPQLLH